MRISQKYRDFGVPGLFAMSEPRQNPRQNPANAQLTVQWWRIVYCEFLLAGEPATVMPTLFSPAISAQKV